MNIWQWFIGKNTPIEKPKEKKYRMRKEVRQYEVGYVSTIIIMKKGEHLTGPEFYGTVGTGYGSSIDNPNITTAMVRLKQEFLDEMKFQHNYSYGPGLHSEEIQPTTPVGWITLPDCSVRVLDIEKIEFERDDEFEIDHEVDITEEITDDDTDTEEYK